MRGASRRPLSDRDHRSLGAAAARRGGPDSGDPDVGAAITAAVKKNYRRSVQHRAGTGGLGSAPGALRNENTMILCSVVNVNMVIQRQSAEWRHPSCRRKP